MEIAVAGLIVMVLAYVSYRLGVSDNMVGVTLALGLFMMMLGYSIVG